MKWLLVLLVACGGKSPPPQDPDPSPPTKAGTVKDTRSELDKRRDAACEVVAKRVTACAVEDAKKDLASGKTTKANFDKDTAKEVVAKNESKYADECKSHLDYSSRQIRVLEKCPQYETECAPLLSCLDNVKPKQ
jgi:hypothetical protein